MSALNTRRALDASLTRLQTGYIDLYQFHHVDRNTPWEEIWQAIDVAVQHGSIYNLLTRDIEREVIPAARQYGLGILPLSPLHGGLRGGVLKQERQGVRRAEGRALDEIFPGRRSVPEDYAR